MKKILAMVACCGLFSCSSVGYFSMDALYPSEVSFPSEVRSVGVIDNTVTHDTLPPVGTTLKLIKGDGKLMAHQLAVNIADADYFDEVILCDSSLRADEQLDAHFKLPQEKVRQLASDLDVDMLVTVDGLSVKLWSDTRSLPDSPELVDVIGGEVSTVISLYLPSRKSPMQLALGAQDTIYWEVSDFLTREMIVENASTHAASLPLKYLVPRWKSEERFFYSGGSVNMRDAAVYVRENNWEEAYLLWKKTYDSSAPASKKRMYAALNIALYYEMQSNISEAMKYAKEAMDMAKPGSVDKKNITFYYIGQLSPRSQEIQKLDLQMSRFK